MLGSWSHEGVVVDYVCSGLGRCAGGVDWEFNLIETLSNPQQSWGESCTQVAITKATEKNSVVYYVRV